MSNYDFSDIFQRSSNSTIIYNYIIPIGFLLLALALGIVSVNFLRRPRYSYRYTYPSNSAYNQSVLAKSVPSKPVIAYKKAMLTFETVDKTSHCIDFHFNGVSGNVRYEMKEDNCIGLDGFHMYKDIKDAFNHDQYGNVILEVVGYGEVSEYELGYTTTGQKVLQIIIDSTVFNKDDTIRFFMDHNNLTLKELYANQWVNRDGIGIVFSPKKPYVFSDGANICTIPQYITTSIN